MTVCPNCNLEIESSFGPKACSHCGTLMFVDLDGTAELPIEAADPLPPPVLESSFLPLANAPTLETLFVADEFSEQTEMGDEFESGSAARVVAESNNVKIFTTPLAPSTSAGALESIQSFANSEASDGHDGEFIFDLKIEGIDTESQKRDFRDALSDKRFKIDADLTLKNIRNGSLRMPGLSAIKASVLIGRLKSLSFEITWVQRRLIDPTPTVDSTSADEPTDFDKVGLS